jgi:DNA-damage-inducible protein J
MLHIRVDDDIKTQATLALQAMGLSMSDAVRIFLHRIVAEQAFPLELKVPNAATREAMAEADAITQSRNARFATPEALFANLEKNRSK